MPSLRPVKTISDEMFLELAVTGDSDVHFEITDPKLRWLLPVKIGIIEYKPDIHDLIHFNNNFYIMVKETRGVSEEIKNRLPYFHLETMAVFVSRIPKRDVFLQFISSLNENDDIDLTVDIMYDKYQSVVTTITGIHNGMEFVATSS